MKSFLDQLVEAMGQNEVKFTVQSINDFTIKPLTVLKIMFDCVQFIDISSDYHRIVKFENVKQMQISDNQLILSCQQFETQYQLIIIDIKIDTIAFELQKRILFKHQVCQRLKSLNFLSLFQAQPWFAKILFKNEIQQLHLFEAYIEGMGSIDNQVVFLNEGYEFSKGMPADCFCQYINQWSFRNFEENRFSQKSTPNSQLILKFPTQVCQVFDNDYLPKAKEILFTQQNLLPIERSSSSVQLIESLHKVQSKCELILSNLTAKNSKLIAELPSLKEQINFSIFLRNRRLIQQYLQDQTGQKDLIVAEKCNILSQRQDLRLVCNLSQKLAQLNYDVAISEFRFLNHKFLFAPGAIVQQLLNVTKAIHLVVRIQTQTSEPLTADDLIPIFIFCFVRAKLDKAQSTATVIEKLTPDSLLLGQAGYLQTIIQLCIDFVLQF